MSTNNVTVTKFYDLPPNGSIILTNEVLFQWFHGRQISIFTVKSTSHTTVDAWVANVKAVIDEWPADMPYLVLHDISTEKVSVSPYLRARAKEFSAHRTDLDKYVATVVPKGLMAQLAQLYLLTFGGRNVHTRMFFDKQNALDWLIQHLKDNSTNRD